MKNKLSIGAPYRRTDADGESLCVDTIWTVAEKDYCHTFYYKVGEQWGKYLVTERSDPWIVTFIWIAMEYSCDIEFTVPVSEDLKYQFERYFIPITAQHFDKLHEISLVGPVTSEPLPSENVTGTGFSGGVDSFYSILSHRNTGIPGKDVTHLVLTVNGTGLSGLTEEVDEMWYQQMMGRLTPLADEMGLKLIGIRSNVNDINGYRDFDLHGESVVTLAFVFTLAKLFGTYYWASGYPADVFMFNADDGAYMDLFILPLLSVRGGIRFYLSGMETNREGKVKFIADDPIVQKGLMVCTQPVNCGRCKKCLRTMTELTAIGELDKFDKAFPVADYKAHYTSRLADYFTWDHAPFTTDIKKTMQENGVRIPFTVYAKEAFFYGPYNYARKKLRLNPLAARLYYRTRLGKKLNNVEYDERYVQARIEGKGNLHREGDRKKKQ